ncbi:unnamed protein product [Eruca vesicaria subsp. sativa]|uniref:Uncharacterized protein n=1 Tax=Eruca vesicaria subsp. sativa TaxID=29727 RepID=A0ABC8KAA0_ERUVS|nr:unnamed protein product [Eruca vesicaria subsp. sativa]
MNLPSLRFLRAISYKETKQGDLSIMSRPYWKVELISSGSNQVPDKPDESVESELLAYYSLIDQ